MTELARVLQHIAATPMALCELPENTSHAIAELDDGDLFRLLAVLDATVRSNASAVVLVQRELAARRAPLPPVAS